MWNIGPASTSVKQPELVSHPALHKFGRFRTDVDANPLAVQLLSGDTRRSTTRERIEHHIVFIATCFDDTIEQ